MNTLDNFTRLYALKSTFGISQQKTSTSIYIMQSQLKKKMQSAFPLQSDINDFVAKHYNMGKQDDKRKLVDKIARFIERIPDMSDANISKFNNIIDLHGIEGIVDYLTQNISKKIKYS